MIMHNDVMVAPSMTKTWALVEASQAGNMTAFGQLANYYHGVILRYVLSRTGDRTLAEDLTQETFCRALRRIDSVSYHGRDIGAWLVTIARNLTFDHVKSSRYRLEQLKLEEWFQDKLPAEIAERVGGTGAPEQRMLDAAITGELLRCVRRLNTVQRKCIELRFFQGFSITETAGAMGRSPGAVKALQHRAVRQLAQLLPQNGVTFETRRGWRD